MTSLSVYIKEKLMRLTVMFIRSNLNPILKPNLDNNWESRKVYNPGIIFFNGAYHMFYRAVGKGDDWSSSIGYAVSKNGENFSRFDEPLLVRENIFEMRGLDDPRITRINDTFYMAYAAYDGITARLSVATSQNLKEWQRHGPVFSDWDFDRAGGQRKKLIDGKFVIKPKQKEWSKSGGIFPEKINGKYQMLFGEFNIWFAESVDGINWIGDQSPFLNPRQGNYFDNMFVEMGPPPIKTDKGWLILYHGIDYKLIYKIGFLILDYQNPRKILFRSDMPIFEPKEKYETSGMVDMIPGGYFKMQNMTEEKLTRYLAEAESKDLMPHVTFCCGATVVDGILRIYYGASDTYICTATAPLQDILNNTI
jgi:beta-1,2-mannobiose phosphorylase / 1,2-beta-oligomannan phosphorylase